MRDCGIAYAAAAASLLVAGPTAPATAQASPAAAPGGNPPAAPAPPPPACDTPDHRRFDFWVGRWEVHATGTDRLVARSLIENLHGGCVIRENWMPLQGAGGTSLSSWIPSERGWRQLWADGANAFDDYRGGLDGEAMVLTADTVRPDGTRARLRMRFTREPDGAVRQVGTRSTDGGATWQPAYDLTYRRAAE